MEVIREVDFITKSTPGLLLDERIKRCIDELKTALVVKYLNARDTE